jgi:hypothetical protein
MEMAIEPREAFVAWLLPRLVRHTQKGDGR